MSRPTQGPAKNSTHTGLSPTMAGLSRPFWLFLAGHWPGPRSLATTNGVSVDVLSSGYLDVSVHQVCFLTLCIQVRMTLKAPGCPIRKSTDQRLLSPNRSLSQSATSFIASQCQGIHQMLLSCLRFLNRPCAGARSHLLMNAQRTQLFWKNLLPCNFKRGLSKSEDLPT